MWATGDEAALLREARTPLLRLQQRVNRVQATRPTKDAGSQRRTQSLNTRLPVRGFPTRLRVSGA